MFHLGHQKLNLKIVYGKNDIMDWRKIEGLECLVKPGKEQGAAVVLLHGYGADAKDLAQLESYLRLSPEVTWYFPQGPLRLAMGPSMMGYAWFPLDEKALEAALAQGIHRDFSTLRPPGIDHAKTLLKKFYDKISAHHKHIVVGGFSQGAMLSTDFVLSEKKKPRALVILSGVLIDKAHWSQWVKSCEDLPFFMSHGTHDALLSHQGAEQLENLLCNAGAIGEMITFRGGHEIPPRVLTELKSFLQAATH